MFQVTTRHWSLSMAVTEKMSTRPEMWASTSALHHRSMLPNCCVCVNGLYFRTLLDNCFHALFFITIRSFEKILFLTRGQVVHWYMSPISNLNIHISNTAEQFCIVNHVYDALFFSLKTQGVKCVSYSTQTTTPRNVHINHPVGIFQNYPFMIFNSTNQHVSSVNFL